MELTPINRTTTAQAVADQLLRLIRRGALGTGDQLPSERELMEKLAVGRSSIRGAFQILATLNVITVMPGQGTFVKEPQISDILRTDLIGFLLGKTVGIELLEARQMIEPAIARLACVRATEEDIQSIEVLLVTHSKALADGKPVVEFAMEFHIMLARAAHNHVMVKFMQLIQELLVQRGRNVKQIPGYPEQEIKEHREILALIRAGEADLAAEAMHKHIIRAAPLYESEDGAK